MVCLPQGAGTASGGVGTDDFDDDEPYDPTEFIDEDDEF